MNVAQLPAPASQTPDWTLTYEVIQCSPVADQPVAASRFGISMDGVQVASSA